jgi:predicted nucleotidyltransferase
LLDFSQRRELSLHAEVAADVTTALASAEILGIVVGAFVRDLHLHYGAGIPIQRGTEDIDFAFAVRTWDEFHALRRKLLESGQFQSIEGKQHRLRHRNTKTVDLVPFGNVETEDRTVAWPPAGEVVMDVFGFQEAAATASPVLLPGGVGISIVSLPALALLKIVAWHDRHRRFPGKDAADLMLITSTYLDVASNKERLFAGFVVWTDEPDFDYELSGARLLGTDIRRLVSTDGLSKLNTILEPQIDEEYLGELPQEMSKRAPDLACSLLRHLHKGLHDG